MEWTDATTRTQNNPTPMPNSWELKTKHLRIYITRGHRLDPGKWVMHCHDVRIDTYSMKIDPAATPEQAQELAIRIVRNRLQQMIGSLEDTKSEQP